MSKLSCILDANYLAHKSGKIFCVKNLGKLVAGWREASGLNARELAEMVEKAGGHAKRQNIEQLEAGDVSFPRYLPFLAKAMGTTVEALMAGRAPAPRQRRAGAPVTPPPQPAPTVPPAPPGQQPDSDFVTLEMIRNFTEEEKAFLREVAEVRMRQGARNTEALRRRFLAPAKKAAAPKTALGRPVVGQDASSPADKLLGGDSQIGGLDEIATTTSKRPKGK